MPTAGYGPFGLVPDQVQLPSPYGDLSAVYPNLSGTNASVSAAIASKLHGDLSPGTIAQLQDDAARYGVESGMPGIAPGTLSGNRLLRSLLRSREDQVQQGIDAYGRIIPTVSSTQTVRPETQINLAEQNALSAAAPNPAAAQTYAQGLFNQYLAMTRGGGGGARRVGTSTGSSGAPGGFDWSANTPWFNQGPAVVAKGTGPEGGVMPYDVGSELDFGGGDLGFEYGMLPGSTPGNSQEITPVPADDWFGY